MRKRTLVSAVAGLCSLFAMNLLPAVAQTRLPRSILAESARVSLSNTVLPKAKLATDLGAAPGDTALESLSLRFSMTSAQTAALDKLLAAQQNPSSPLYHQWLTPEQFASRFGLDAADIATVSNWLQGQGLKVTGVARGGTFVQFSGSVAQVEKAFGVTLHSVKLNGETHITNLTDPVLPASIANVTVGMTGLNDFRLKSRVKARKVPAKPDYNGGTNYGNLIAPGDFYTIYDLKPLLNAATPINGSGITIGVMGQVDISSADVKSFRSAAGLTTTNLPTTKTYGTDPGSPSSACLSNNPPNNCSPSIDDLYESTLDVEWAGATAPSASILFVNGQDVFANAMTSAIDNDVAPLLTVSYGDCEVGFTAAGLAQYNLLFKQANAQGQTVLGPAGDSGAADCDYNVTLAEGGLAVDFPASSPYVTAVGGTEFNENGGTYFGTTNGTNGDTALSYIPEQPWNETFITENGTFFGLNYGGAGGGGVSQYFSKPSWQQGTGVPADASRDVPDVAFTAAADHDGYLVCVLSSCTNGFADSSGDYNIFGGTSVSTPSFAGILALLEQKVSPAKGLGNVNPNIYGLANSSYYGTVFHDVTTGTNAVPCDLGSTDCATGYPNFFAAGAIACPANSCNGTTTYPAIGYNAGVGYDLASGWGSIDVNNMVTDWLLAPPVGVSTSALNASNTTAATTTPNVASGASVTVTVTVASAMSGVTTAPTGTVQLLVDNVAEGAAVSLSGGTATLPAFATTNLASGAHNFAASYSGDANYAGSKGAVSVDVTSSTTQDFTLTPATATVTVASGSTAAGVTYTVTPLNGFTGDVTFTTTTTSTSLNGTYSFSVDPVVISGTTAGTTVLTLEAFEDASSQAGTHGLLRRKVAKAVNRMPVNPWTLGGSGVVLAGLLLVAVPKRNRRRWSALVVLLVSVGVISASGCSSSSAGNENINTTPGTYAITVTAQGTDASGNPLTHNVALTFVVQ